MNNDKIELKQDEQLIYQLIVDSKQMGITTTNLVKRAQLNDKQVQKILKHLELFDYIKAVRPNGKAKGMKFWIEFNQELESTLPSNPFRLSDQSINQELIDKIRQKIIVHLQNTQQCTLKELQLIYKSTFDQTEYNESDFNRIMNLLLYDNIIESVDQGKCFKLNPFRVSQFQFYFQYVPCQTCPVFKDCKPGNMISPENCVYKW